MVSFSFAYTICFEGYGLQPVRSPLAVNLALAAEGSYLAAHRSVRG
jgi:hypothetical protein